MSNLAITPDLARMSVKGDATVELLVFAIGKLTLALPILQVQKVVRQSEVHGSGLSHINLTHLPEGEIAVVDLQQKLFGTSLTQSTATGYFIITQPVNAEPLGIVVSKPPSLIDVPLKQIRQLPDTYRRADTLAIASHVTVVADKEKSTTLFILDLARLTE